MLTTTRSKRLADRIQRLTSYDFAPEFSEKVRRAFYHPLGIMGLAAFVSLLCGLFLHPQGFILCGGILAVVALGVLWPMISLPALSGAISFSRRRVTEGETVEVQLSLKNRLPWPVWGLAVRDGFGFDAQEAVVGIRMAPRRRSALCRWAFQPTRRGLYPQPLPKLTTGFPFGLWNHSKTLAVESQLIVWPTTFPVGPVPMLSGEQQSEGKVSRNKVGTNGDVLGVRPYRRGDSPRRIHWAQSARHDRLIVCEIQANSRPVIQLVLDTFDEIHAGREENSTGEWAIRVAASFAKSWIEEGAEVGLLWGGGHLPPASGSNHLTKIMDTLAGLQFGKTPLAQVMETSACQGFADGLQIFITTNLSVCPPPRGHQRFVILNTHGFDPSLPVETASDGNQPTVSPWLTLENPEAIPTQLLGNWQEAKHGS